MCVCGGGGGASHDILSIFKFLTLPPSNLGKGSFDRKILNAFFWASHDILSIFQFLTAPTSHLVDKVETKGPLVAPVMDKVETKGPPTPVNRRTETLKTLPSHHTSYVCGKNSDISMKTLQRNV